MTIDGTIMHKKGDVTFYMMSNSERVLGQPVARPPFLKHRSKWTNIFLYRPLCVLSMFNKPQNRSELHMVRWFPFTLYDVIPVSKNHIVAKTDPSDALLALYYQQCDIYFPAANQENQSEFITVEEEEIPDDKTVREILELNKLTGKLVQ
jgi:hypothetical protein